MRRGVRRSGVLVALYFFFFGLGEAFVKFWPAKLEKVCLRKRLASRPDTFHAT
jgi:hypothetical protein